MRSYGKRKKNKSLPLEGKVGFSTPQELKRSDEVETFLRYPVN